jgi:hypothetical protein
MSTINLNPGTPRCQTCNNKLECGCATVPDIKCARALARALDAGAAAAFSPSDSAWSGELSRRFMWLRIQSHTTGVASRCVTDAGHRLRWIGGKGTIGILNCK